MKFGCLEDRDIELAKQGDKSSMNRLATAIHIPIYHLALRQLGHHDDALDVTQEALIKVTSSLDSFRGESQFSTWVWSVATRCLIDYGRVQKKRPQLSFEDFAQDLSEGLMLSEAPRSENLVLLGQVKLGCARAMLQCLEAEDRMIYVLGEILELEQTVVAEVMDISHSTIRKRLQRIREKISNELHRMCGVVNTKAKCSCRGRLKRAEELGRLDSRDSSRLDLSRFQEYVQTIDKIRASAEFFRVDVSQAKIQDLHLVLDKIPQ